jgi:hypothetical protein
MLRYRIIHQNTNIEIPAGRFLIGRSPECHLVLDDPSVSRTHATIVLEESGLFLEDMGSRNGCTLNGTRVEGRHKLQDGDRVVIGHQIIRVVAMERLSGADRTMALGNCRACGMWLSADDKICPHCGARQDEAAAGSRSSRPEERGSVAAPKPSAPDANQQPITMMSGLVLKAVSMGKLDEAMRLLDNLLGMAARRAEAGPIMAEGDLQAVGDAAISLATVSKSSETLSRMFAFFNAAKALMPRATVEKLYDAVRIVGYRRCPEMTRYLAALSSRTGEFSPSDRFIHRRLEGLVKLCS